MSFFQQIAAFFCQLQLFYGTLQQEHFLLSYLCL